jgi:hypothetical protein
VLDDTGVLVPEVVLETLVEGVDVLDRVEAGDLVDDIVPEDVFEALPDFVAETVGVFVLLVVAEVVDEAVTVGVTLLDFDILADAEEDGDPVAEYVE